MNKLYINNTSKNNKAMKALFSIAALGLLALTAQADEREKGFYIGGGIGMPFAKDFVDREEEPYASAGLSKKAMYTIDVGYRLNNYLRTDINTQFRSFKYHANPSGQLNLTQNIKNYTMFFNMYLEMPANHFVPYITAGAGYSYNNTGNLRNTINEAPAHNYTANGIKTFNIAYNFGLGTVLKLHKNIDLDFKYRWVNAGKVKVEAAVYDGEDTVTGYPSTQDLKFHEFTLGITYNF